MRKISFYILIVLSTLYLLASIGDLSMSFGIPRSNLSYFEIFAYAIAFLYILGYVPLIGFLFPLDWKGLTATLFILFLPEQFLLNYGIPSVAVAGVTILVNLIVLIYSVRSLRKVVSPLSFK